MLPARKAMLDKVFPTVHLVRFLPSYFKDPRIPYQEEQPFFSCKRSIPTRAAP